MVGAVVFVEIKHVLSFAVKKYLKGFFYSFFHQNFFCILRLTEEMMGQFQKNNLPSQSHQMHPLEQKAHELVIIK